MKSDVEYFSHKERSQWKSGIKTIGDKFNMTLSHIRSWLIFFFSLSLSLSLSLFPSDSSVACVNKQSQDYLNFVSFFGFFFI